MATKLTSRLTRDQAIDILWAKMSPNTPINDHWRHVLGSSYEWAVVALIETSEQYERKLVDPDDFAKAARRVFPMLVHITRHTEFSVYEATVVMNELLQNPS